MFSREIMPTFDLKCLQIGNTDLTGNKFNGHNLSIYLKEYGIISNHLVQKKCSNVLNTFVYPLKKHQNFANAIINDRLFLEADIIHLHLIHRTKFDINYLPLLCSLKPVIITLHDPFFTTGHCIHSFGCDKWKTFCYDCDRLNVPFKIGKDATAYNFLTKKLAIQNSNITAIVASNYMENLVKQSPVWDGKKLYKIPFGVDSSIFTFEDKNCAKKKLGIDPNSLVLMFRATDNPYKGLKYIKTALSNLKTDRKITLLTVEGKRLLSEFRKKFEIKEYSWVYDDNELAKLYQAADLFLMPSDEEAFGMMAIEAMSCGTPVLSIKGTSLEGVTNSPSCGVCVEKEDFLKALQNLINNPDEIRQRGEKSLKFAKENYDKDIYVKKIIEAYKETIARHKENQTPGENLALEQMKKYSCANTRAVNSSGKLDFVFSRRISGDCLLITILGIKIKIKLKNNRK